MSGVSFPSWSGWNPFGRPILVYFEVKEHIDCMSFFKDCWQLNVLCHNYLTFGGMLAFNDRGMVVEVKEGKSVGRIPLPFRCSK